MPITEFGGKLADRVHRFVLKGFAPHYGGLRSRFPSNPVWRRFREVGSELWFDSGDIEDVAKDWTQEFTALTTNNTLLNKEVQKGIYDDLLAEAAKVLDDFPELTDQERKLELAFIINARHGLRLVETFDAKVSVEEHTDLAGDLEGAVNYARRFYAICPQRFYVKIPFTAAGLLATRRVSAEGIPVNHTLGFSARQNYVITRIGRPIYVNVFLGRLNSVIQDNHVGDGKYVGERSTLASQAVVLKLDLEHGLDTRQIAASIRSGEQVRDLAGVNVLTIPLKAAREFLDLKIPPRQIKNGAGENYRTQLDEGVDAEAIGLDALWDVGPEVISATDALDKADVGTFTPDDLIDFFARRGCGDVFCRWTQEQVALSAREGKIPTLSNWRALLADRKIGLDALMNLAALNSFAADQKQMDDRIRGLVGTSKG